MSYILDALRKADAQRERDPARGIHAQPAALPLAEADAAGKLPVPLMAAAVGLALMGVGLIGWRMERTEPPVIAVPVAAPTIAAAPPPPAAVVLPAPLPVPPAPAPAPEEAKKIAREIPAAKAAAAQPEPVPAPDRIFAQSELPADVQRELPRLAISGAVYSDNPAQRMLIANGQVVNEGAELAPGLVLEQIRAKTAVLKFRGLRFSLGY